MPRCERRAAERVFVSYHIPLRKPLRVRFETEPHGARAPYVASPRGELRAERVDSSREKNGR